jgi:hypothetical protein
MSTASSGTSTTTSPSLISCVATTQRPVAADTATPHLGHSTECWAHHLVNAAGLGSSVVHPMGLRETPGNTATVDVAADILPAGGVLQQ